MLLRTPMPTVHYVTQCSIVILLLNFEEVRNRQKRFFLVPKLLHIFPSGMTNAAPSEAVIVIQTTCLLVDHRYGSNLTFILDYELMEYHMPAFYGDLQAQ